MSWLDRVTWGMALAIVAAVVLPIVLPLLIKGAVVGSTCYIAVQLVRYLTSRA